MQKDSATNQNGADVPSTALLNRVYDLLVSIGGASESFRQSFVQNHMDEDCPCTEWRFCGHLGFGGKYRSETHTVDCYREDETQDRKAVISALNAALDNLFNPTVDPRPTGKGEGDEASKEV